MRRLFDVPRARHPWCSHAPAESGCVAQRAIREGSSRRRDEASPTRPRELPASMPGRHVAPLPDVRFGRRRASEHMPGIEYFAQRSELSRRRATRASASAWSPRASVRGDTATARSCQDARRQRRFVHLIERTTSPLRPAASLQAARQAPCALPHPPIVHRLHAHARSVVIPRLAAAPRAPLVLRRAPRRTALSREPPGRSPRRPVHTVAARPRHHHP